MNAEHTVYANGPLRLPLTKLWSIHLRKAPKISRRLSNDLRRGALEPHREEMLKANTV
jgi:hypothetical protein